MTIDAAQSGDVDAVFKHRVRHFLAKAAVAIANEANNAAEHKERIRWARQFATNPDGYVPGMCAMVVTNSTILAAGTLATIPDTDLEFAVNSMLPVLYR